MVVVVVLVVAVGILALLGYVVHRAKPTRFKLSAGVWKVLTLNVEVDSEPDADAEKPAEGRRSALTESEPKELPDSEPKALPHAGSKALPKGGGDLLARLPGSSRVHRGVAQRDRKCPRGAMMV
jgi:hypothetical protein